MDIATKALPAPARRKVDLWDSQMQTIRQGRSAKGYTR